MSAELSAASEDVVDGDDATGLDGFLPPVCSKPSDE